MIVFNCTTNVVGGAVQNSVNFIREIKKNHSLKNKFHFFLSEQVYEQIKEIVSESEFDVFKSPAKNIFVRKKIKLRCIEINPKLVYTSAGPAYVKFDCYHIMGCSNPYVLGANSYALNLLGSRFKIWLRNLHTQYQRKYILQAESYICQTKSSAHSLSNLGVSEDCINVVYNAISNDFSSFFNNVDIDIDVENYNSKNECKILIPTAYYRHKDLERIAMLASKVNSRSKMNIKFYFTIKDYDFKKLINYSGNGDFLCNLGPYQHSEALSMYLSYDFVLQPSVLEVFSTSYIEAISVKKQLLVPDFNFTKDICQCCAVYYDPESDNDLIDKIIYVSNNFKVLPIDLDSRSKLLNIYGTQKDRINKIISILEEAVK